MGPLVTRFAPSPTGFLHLGHIVNAIYVWGIARRTGARVLFRMEDHDRIRCRPEYDRALLEDLAWLGFEADEPVWRQSEHPEVYEGALHQLRREHHVFACDCSRRELGGGEIYAGRCRRRGLADAPGRGLRIEQCDDLLLRDRDGHWTYQFSVTVDDYRQGVNLIIRGQDLEASTARQMKLARLLGRADTPRFIHHPLVVKAGGEKLSKAARDTGIRDLRAAGVDAATAIGMAAARAGLTPAPRPIAAADVPSLFSDFSV